MRIRFRTCRRKPARSRGRGCAEAGIPRKWRKNLREKKGVLLVAGEQLGMESFVRFGFGGDSQHLQKALVRIDEWLHENRVQTQAR